MSEPLRAPPQQPPAVLTGRWFDGLSSKPRPVAVAVQPGAKGPTLALHLLSAPGAPATTFTHDQVGWPEAWNERRPQPRVVVDLRERGSLEVDAVAQWYAALAAAGARPGVAQRMQTRWPVLLGVLAVSVVGLGLFYRYGTPWAAAQLTRFVPLSWEARLSDNVLQRMDQGFLKPSKLPAERQAQLKARFDALVQQTPPGLQRYQGYRPPLTLEFRSGMPANAFALPGGKVVMTDDIVKVAADKGLPDDALVGVLAHEIGHVVHRHSTRLVVEQGVLNVGLGLALGDVSGVVSTGATVLTGRAYSRNHEREADCYAIALMGHASLPTAPMGKLLLAIAHEEEDEDKKAKGGTSTAPAHPGASPASATASASTPAGVQASEAVSGAASAPQAQASGTQRSRAQASPVWSLLSSHPDTVERATELEQGHAPHCAR
jgi:Zn-dependent protease with chaperone function